MRRIVLSILVSSSFLISSGAQAGELSLSSVLTHELNQVLQVSSSLHLALVGRDEEQIELGLRDLLVQLDRTRSFATLAKPHERSHLVRILEAARDQFEQTHSAVGENRRNRFVSGYNQLANLVRIYKLDRNFGIFFCPKDRTNWVQKGSKPMNPFRGPASKESCGMKIPR